MSRDEFLGIANFFLCDCWWCGDVSERRFGAVRIYASVLSVETALKEPASDSAASEHPAYKWPIVNVVVAQIRGNCAEELDFISFEDVRAVGLFLFWMGFFFCFSACFLNRSSDFGLDVPVFVL